MAVDREQHRAYMRQWHKRRSPDVCRQCCGRNDNQPSQRCRKCADVHAAQARQRRQSADEKMKRCAREAVRRAVQSGRLVRPTACGRCGAERPVQAHHHDYADRLRVDWLCPDCHGVEHRLG